MFILSIFSYHFEKMFTYYIFMFWRYICSLWMLKYCTNVDDFTLYLNVQRICLSFKEDIYFRIPEKYLSGTNT